MPAGQGREKHPQEQDACKMPWQSVPQYNLQVALQFLLWARGTPMVVLASLCIRFVVVMGACCGLLLRRDLGHASGLQAFSVFWL